jgi:hypothetical protein
MEKKMVKCCTCGRFVGLHEMASGAAKFHFVPDNHFGPEETEWTCGKCAKEEASLRQDSTPQCHPSQDT